MAGADAMHERIAAHPWPRGGVEVIRANRGYRGRLRIRAKSTHKPGDGAARARLMISPTIPRLAWPAILAWI